MAWHLLCPAALSMGSLVAGHFQTAALTSRRLISLLLRLKFRVAEALLPAAPPHLHPVKRPWPVKRLLLARASCFPGVLGWEKVAHGCPGEAAMPSGQSSGFRVFLKFLGLATRTKAGLWPESQAQHLSLLVPDQCYNPRLLVPCCSGPCHFSTRLCLPCSRESSQCPALCWEPTHHRVRPSHDLTGRDWFLNFTDEECVTQKLRTLRSQSQWLEPGVESRAI